MTFQGNSEVVKGLSLGELFVDADISVPYAIEVFFQKNISCKACFCLWYCIVLH